MTLTFELDPNRTKVNQNQSTVYIRGNIFQSIWSDEVIWSDVQMIYIPVWPS